ncbi:MAG: hypothetical protein ACI8PQ_003229 [Planctomycetota bacterium]|jgi:hypothetical protein
MRFSNLVLALSTLALASSCNILPSARVTPRIGTLELDGDISAGTPGLSATADMEDLGFIDDGNVFSPRVDLAWGPVDLIASGFNAKYEGDGTADVALTIGGDTISIGEAVHSELDLSMVTLLAVWDFVPTDVVDFGLGLGAQVIDFDTSITSLGMVPVTIETAESAPFPVLAARGAFQLFDLEISAVASGVSLDISGVDATFVDLDIMASYTFEEFLGFYGALVAGYRQIDMDVEYSDSGSDVALDFSLSGPYFGLTLGL